MGILLHNDAVPCNLYSIVIWPCSTGSHYILSFWIFPAVPSGRAESVAPGRRAATQPPSHLAVQRREPPGKLHKDKKRTAPACSDHSFTSWFSPIQIGHYSVFHLAVPFITANPGSLIQFLNRTIPQKPLNLLAFFDMSQLSHDPRAQATADGITWMMATSATQMANASTAELTATTGYSSKTAAGLQPTCLGFEIHSHACRI